MRKVVVSEFLTLDGVMDDPGGSDGTPNGGWSFRVESTEDNMKFKFDELLAADALLLGRKTYEGFAAAWPTMEGTGAFGERMNGLPKYVVSTTLKKLEWNNSRLIDKNVVEAVTKLKQEPGQDILVFGSGALTQTQSMTSKLRIGIPRLMSTKRTARIPSQLTCLGLIALRSTLALKTTA